MSKHQKMFVKTLQNFLKCQNTFKQMISVAVIGECNFREFGTEKLGREELVGEVHFEANGIS